jgi:hypothetical protein
VAEERLNISDGLLHSNPQLVLCSVHCPANQTQEFFFWNLRPPLLKAEAISALVRQKGEKSQASDPNLEPHAALSV